MPKERINQFVSEHAWKIVAAAFALYGGYITGQTTTQSRLESIEANLMRIEARQMRIEDRLDTVRTDPFTGTMGRELEERLRDEINRRHP